MPDLLGNTKRKKPVDGPADAEKQELDQKKKRKVTTQILIIPKKKGQAASPPSSTAEVPAEGRVVTSNHTKKGKQPEVANDNEDKEQEGGGLFSLMADYGDSDEDGDNDGDGDDKAKDKDNEDRQAAASNGTTREDDSAKAPAVEVDAK
jgi:hypothetical protein